MAPEIINNSPSPLPSNVRLTISEFNVYGDVKMPQATNSYVKSFCASTGQYRAKELDPLAKQAQEDSYNKDENGENNDFSVFPNPAFDQITFRFYLENSSNVKIRIYDISGNLVSVITDKSYNAGNHEILFDAKNVLPGLYMTIIETFKGKDFKKIAIIR
jgi:flagellar hook assembly protein FlgD